MQVASKQLTDKLQKIKKEIAALKAQLESGEAEETETLEEQLAKAEETKKGQEKEATAQNKIIEANKRNLKKLKTTVAAATKEYENQVFTNSWILTKGLILAWS